MPGVALHGVDEAAKLFGLADVAQRLHDLLEALGPAACSEHVPNDEAEQGAHARTLANPSAAHGEPSEADTGCASTSSRTRTSGKIFSIRIVGEGTLKSRMSKICSPSTRTPPLAVNCVLTVPRTSRVTPWKVRSPCSW